VNALQSETEKNIQRGTEQLLRGIYLSIRNPRSHEQFKDTQKDADAIIYFLDYLLRILNASKEAFTVEGFMASLADPEFVESKRYAELLIAELPANRRGDAILALFKSRATVELNKLWRVVSVLLSLLNEAQLAEYLTTVSDELRTASQDRAIRTALQMLTPELWPRISETTRLRIENKLIKNVESGKLAESGKSSSGALGTWSNNFIKAFTLRKEAGKVLIKMLEGELERRHYAGKFFMRYLPEILTEEADIRRGIRAISSAIRAGDVYIRELVIKRIGKFPGTWQVQLAESLKDLTNPSNPALVLDGGFPFLEAPTATDTAEEDASV
jgi:hypothetical protein